MCALMLVRLCGVYDPLDSPSQPMMKPLGFRFLGFVLLWGDRQKQLGFRSYSLDFVRIFWESQILGSDTILWYRIFEC